MIYRFRKAWRNQALSSYGATCVSTACNSCTARLTLVDPSRMKLVPTMNTTPARYVSEV
jgi:hypothetical protein